MPPNIRLINPISSRFTWKIHSRWAAYLGRAEPGPNAKINCLFSHCHIFYIRALYGLSIIFLVAFFLLPTFIPRHLSYVHARYLFVTDTLLTPTITEPPSVECQELLTPTRSNACVARIDLGPIRTQKEIQIHGPLMIYKRKGYSVVLRSPIDDPTGLSMVNYVLEVG